MKTQTTPKNNVFFTESKSIDFDINEFLKKSLDTSKFRINNPNTKTKSSINNENRYIKIQNFLLAYWIKAKKQNGSLATNSNNKIKDLGRTLKELTLIASESIDLVKEVLTDKYNWMTQKQVNQVVELIEKLGKTNINQVGSLDLTAGWSCPNANECLVKADKFSGELRYMGCFDCYASMHENQYLDSRVLRWYNFDLIRSLDFENLVDVLSEFLAKFKVVRLHSSGDIFNKKYMNALIQACKNNPDTIVYGYTKMIDFIENLPNNLYIIYSVGGKQDNKLTCKNNIATSTVSLNHTDSAVCKTSDIYSQAEDFFKIVLGESVVLNLH